MSVEFDVDDEPCECCGTPEDRAASARRKLHRTLAGSTLFLWDLGPATATGPWGLWASDSYWMAPAAVVRDLLEWWNLPVAPSAYDVTENRVAPSDRTPPSIESVTKILRPVAAVPLTLRRVAGSPMLALTEVSTCAVYDRTGPGVLLNTEYLDIAAPLWKTGSTYVVEQDKANKEGPVIFRNGDSIEAAIMPVRVQ